MSRSISHPVRALLLGLALGSATLASYAPVFSAGFVDIDDADYVPENEVVKAGLRVEGVAWAFGSAHAGNWFPLTWISHMTDVELFGVDPAGHHAMNVAIHVTNALLLFALLSALTGELAPSFLVAGVFALHPMNVESVAWISQRKTTLATFFAILAIAGYARWVRVRTRASYAASLVAFALSLLSKQMFVPLPFGLLLLDYWPLRRPPFASDDHGLPTLRSLWRGCIRLLPEKIPYLLLALAASGATLLAQGEAISTGATFPLPVRLGNAVIAWVRYAGTLLWPANLSVFHPLLEADVTLPRVIACAVLLIAVTAASVALGRRRRYLLVGWLWFLGLLVPVIGLVQVGAQSMADRYAYVPCWGLAVALGFAAWDLAAARRLSRAVFGVATALLLGALALATHRHAGAWHDSIALFESAVATDDRNYVAHRALAAQYFNAGDYARALQHAEAGLRSSRDPGEILPIYGMALYQTGAKEAAVERLVEATRVAPGNVLGFTNLGWVYAQEGRDELAAEALESALAVDPRSARAASLLADTQFRLGRIEAAAASYQRTVALDARNFDARIGWARALAKLGRLAEAADVLADAIAAARDVAGEERERLASTLHLYRGDALSLLGDVPGAIGEYEVSLAAWPQNFATNNRLASLLTTAADSERRDVARAVTLAEHAVALSGRRNPDALGTLAAAYAANGRRDEALRTAREALDVAHEGGQASAVEAAEARLREYEKPPR